MLDTYDFDNPWRKIYEWPMTAAWIAASALTLVVIKTLPVPSRFGVATSLICTGAGAFRAAQAWKRSQDANRIRLAEKEFISIPEIVRVTAEVAKNGQLWMGKGFQWTDIESNRMHALMSRGIAAQLGKDALNKEGAYWLHGLAKEEGAVADLALLDGHTLIVGATGVGKTRIFDLFIAQAIARGEPVIIIDPKGDHGLAENARRVCEAIGEPEKFIYFHPAHPEKSACIDPLRNWNRKTELASRIAALIPSETGADPFTAFGWKVLNDIVNGLIATGQRPNLVQLRRYIEGGPDSLLLKALRTHFKSHVRRSVPGVGQAEVDDVHVAVERPPPTPVTIVPVEAKAKDDPVNRVQIAMQIRYAQHSFPDHPIRPLTVKLFETGLVLMMEFNVTTDPGLLEIVRHQSFRFRKPNA